MSRKLQVKIKETNGDQNYLYAYKQAANFLYAKIEKDLNNGNNDFSTVIPYMYLVRHTVELSFKLVLFKHNSNYKIPNKPAESHNLVFFCNELKSNLGIELDKYPSFLHIAKEIDTVDKDGTYFKYTGDRKQNHQLKDTVINISDLQELFNKFNNQYMEFVKLYIPELFNPNNAS